MDKDADFRIIVIDDNPAIHHDFVKILTTSDTTAGLDELSQKLFGNKGKDYMPNFQIDYASQGQEGVLQIQKALEENHPYSLAFVDIRMPPGWDGIETIKQIWALDKDVQIVICTAYSDYSWEETVAHLGKTDNLLILKKPFDNISVRQLACALTKKWQLLQDTRKFTESLKKQVEDRTHSLQKTLSLVKATLESSDEGIIVINNEGNIIDYNQKFCSMWDIPQEIIDEKHQTKLLDYMRDQLLDPDHFMEWLDALRNSSGAINIDIIKFKNGKIFDCYSQPQIINENIVGRVLNFRDITERTELETELQYQAKHDALTGLPNRVLLLDRIKELIKTSESDNTMFAVLFLDLDRFKLINDSLSHEAGDDLLRNTATRLKFITRDTDIVTRLGGDEFVLVISNIKSFADINNKAEQILNIFQQPFFVFDREVTVSASIGISVYPKDGKTVDVLLRNADAAMYNVKEMGGNSFEFYTKEMHVKSLEKLDQEMQLRQALANQELFLCYQPQFDIATENLIAVEALLRWNHPDKGLLLPIDFVPLAEQTGLILPIGEWVLLTACKQNKAWQDAGYPPIRIAVNVTAQQLKQHNFVDLVKSILNKTGLKPEYLELELTENIIISSMEVIRTVTQLKQIGITIAIDDFGTGYSSLSYLKNLPLDRLKIDGSFIQNIRSSDDDEVIIRAIIAIAKNLNLEVLAEGVETQSQVNFLKRQSCDEIQGFFYAKPLSINELEDLFKHPINKKKIFSV